MSSAIAAKNTLLVIGSTPIVELTGINGPGMKSDTVDVTHHQSPGNWKEFVPTLKDGGEIGFEINFIPTNATHRNVVGGLIYLLDQQTLQSFSLVYPDSEGTTWTFSAYVVGFVPSAPHDGKLSAQITIKISGPVSFDLGSYTYYIDPVSGNDSHAGTSPSTAWLTTTHADATVPTLGAGESIAYYYNGYWVLYRKPGMTSDDAVLPSGVYTGSSDLYS